MGGQFTLQFDVNALDFQDLTGNAKMNLGKENFGLSRIEEGLILASWNHPTEQNFAQPIEFYNITFTVKQDGQLSDFLSITSRGMEAEAYVEKNGETEFWNIELNFENEITNQGISVFPNPFSEKTELNFSLENNEQVQLRVYDVNGRLVFSQEKNMEKGAHQFEMKKENLGASGIYFFQLLIGEELTAGKIMVE